MSDVTALTAPPPGWYPDRNEANLERWWDGQQWTDHTKSTAPAAAAFEQPVSAAAFGLTNEIAPGWYPDNADPSLQRWWDGRQWTTHTAPGVAVAAPSNAAYLGVGATPLAPYGASTAPRTTSTANTMASLALIFSLVSFAGLIFAPLLALGLAGIVAGIAALRRVRLYAPGAGRRGQAIAGIVVGAISVIATVLLTIAALAVYQQVHSTAGAQAGTNQAQPQSGTSSGDSVITFPLTIADLKMKIATSISRQNNSVAVTTVTCDGAAAMVSGSVFQCGVIVEDGRSGVVSVQIGRPTESGFAFGLSLGNLTSNASAPSPIPQTVSGIQQELTVDLAQAWASPVNGVVCGSGASTALGSQFPCEVTLQNGQSGQLMITIVNPGGFDVTVVRPPEDASGPSGSDNSDNPDLSHS